LPVIFAGRICSSRAPPRSQRAWDLATSQARPMHR